MPIIALLVGLALVVWALVDIRRAEQLWQWKAGWTIVALSGQVPLPSWRLAGGWYVAVPLGAVAYLVLSREGPLRRRLRDAHAQSS
jgi:hypothetical protein